MKKLQKLHLSDAKVMTNSQMKHVSGGAYGLALYACSCYSSGYPHYISAESYEEALRIIYGWCSEGDFPWCEYVSGGY